MTVWRIENMYTNNKKNIGKQNAYKWKRINMKTKSLSPEQQAMYTAGK